MFWNLDFLHQNSGFYYAKLGVQKQSMKYAPSHSITLFILLSPYHLYIIIYDFATWVLPHLSMPGGWV